MNDVEAALRQLWPSVTDEALRALLPHDLDSLRDFYPRLQQYVHAAPRKIEGTIITREDTGANTENCGAVRDQRVKEDESSWRSRSKTQCRRSGLTF